MFETDNIFWVFAVGAPMFIGPFLFRKRLGFLWCLLLSVLFVGIIHQIFWTAQSGFGPLTLVGIGIYGWYYIHYIILSSAAIFLVLYILSKKHNAQ